jgi:hypothetical protein
MGRLSLKPGGGFIFVPAAGFVGGATFLFQVRDNHGGGSAVIRIRIRVLP